MKIKDLIDNIFNFISSYGFIFFILIAIFSAIYLGLANPVSSLEESFDYFEIVCDSDNQIVYRCVNTDVLYLWSKSGYAGGLTVMYNSDGSVLTYDKWLEYESLR